MDDLIRVDLPQYEPPPPYITPDRRRNNPYYDNDLALYLPRTVTLYRRDPTESLGFNIRGGVEHTCGLYISRVLQNSEADRLGLREGDQVIAVNNISFEDIDHTEAVQILKSNLQVEMLVRFFPYGYQKTYEQSMSPPPGTSPR